MAFKHECKCTNTTTKKKDNEKITTYSYIIACACKLKIDLKYLEDIEMGFLIEIIYEINKINSSDNEELEDDVVIATRTDYIRLGL